LHCYSRSQSEGWRLSFFDVGAIAAKVDSVHIADAAAANVVKYCHTRGVRAGTAAANWCNGTPACLAGRSQAGSDVSGGMTDDATNTLHARFVEADNTQQNLRVLWSYLERAFSPDGRWLAYYSDDSGSWEVYVRAFPDKRGKWQTLNSGGVYPAWSRNGRELFYHTRTTGSWW